MINGQKINLIPAALADRRRVYEWCFKSETTKSHSGPPDYPDVPIASYEEFCADYYEEYFFTGAKPPAGRGFLIVNQGEAIGFISYTCFHLKPAFAELDLWLNCEANCGKGFGTDALITLGDFLNRTMHITELLIAPSGKNTRALKSYAKAGFRRSARPMHEFLLPEYVSLYGEGDYGIDGTTILTKQFTD